MSKFVLFLSVVCLSVLLYLGISDPNNPMVWLASTSQQFDILRGGLIVVLFGLLFTHPPRNMYFRIFVGLLSTTLVTWSLYATYNNEMKILDTFVLLLVSISAGLIALERESEELLPIPRYQLNPGRANWHTQDI